MCLIGVNYNTRVAQYISATKNSGHARIAGNFVWQKNTCYAIIAKELYTVFYKGEAMAISSAETSVVEVVEVGTEAKERAVVSEQRSLDREYPPGVRDVFLTGPNIANYRKRTEFWIGRCAANGTFETTDLTDEAQNLGIAGLEVGCLVERVIEGMLAQWGNEPQTEPPARNMWECALSAASTFVLQNIIIRRRIFLAMIVCQGGREKSPAGIVRAIIPNGLQGASSLQAVIDELRAYGCSSEEIALAWEKMLGLRFAQGFETRDILEWWHGLKFGDGCIGRNVADVAEGVNRHCVMRDLKTLIEKDSRDAIQPNSMELFFVDASFLNMVKRICSFCRPEWRHSPSVSEAAEKMFVTCLSRGDFARAFQMFAQFGSYFGLCRLDSSGNIDNEAIATFNQLIHKAIEEASKSHRYGIACALTMQVGCVRDVVRVKHLSALAARHGQKIALNPWFYIRTDNT